MAFVAETLLHAEAGLGQVCYPQNEQVLGAKGHYLRIWPESMGKQLLGSVGSGKTLGESRGWSSNQPKAGTFGNILEMLTPGDTRHLFYGLGKTQKPAFMMVTDFAKDYLIPEEAQPGYEKCRPQSQVD